MVSDFDVLGHIDYVVRYGKEKAEHYSYRKYADEIDAILKKVLDMGKGIELNTGGYKYGLGFAIHTRTLSEDTGNWAEKSSL